ncbi:methyl-accepting chemotaxis protein [Paenibacillus sp. HN-1]|uniref:methyl-accepting chemotaxis protein n=1 Tax=Paenibacillus TaxID=44249 RepID=UPI001CA999D7|nr:MULTISPECIES: methyl-accepting chemotaxis protein [Paenibacillus]MBY9080797.1 methyl-accepting chemotaxis protein [Paenibacillus sp. CGMCC 1.18879]MBY9085211.1 methyl-accepting chemotaxis protein [Paenibacillus sinensis]
MRWIMNMRTSVKLITSFLIVSAILGFVGLYGISNLSKMNNSLSGMYDNGLIPVKSALTAQVSYTRMRVNIRAAYIADTKESLDNAITTYQDESKTVESSIAEFRKTKMSAESQKILEPFDEKWAEVIRLYDQAMKLRQDGRNAEMKSLIDNEISTVGDEVRLLLNELIDNSVAEGEHTKRAGNDLFFSSRNITIIVIIAAVMISIGMGYFISRIISKPLSKVTKLVNDVGNGDLRSTLDIDSKDEVGQLATGMNAMVHNLRGMVGNILAHSQSLAASSQQISASAEEIAHGNDSQAREARMISELFGELSTAVHSVAQNTEVASELSVQAAKAAEEGNGIIQLSNSSMQVVSQQMTRLEDDSQKIGEIIEVIEDIAEQTNLLALNAAIEAARAGEQGRGFAVVADEVRKLAERSGEATKQITKIIKGMQENTRSSVSSVQESADLSERTAESFQRIVSFVNDNGQKVMEIAAASEEQAAQTTTVLSAVENISSATEEAAASSQEMAATSQSLAHLAGELQSSVSTFKI